MTVMFTLHNIAKARILAKCRVCARMNFYGTPQGNPLLMHHLVNPHDINGNTWNFLFRNI